MAQTGLVKRYRGRIFWPSSGTFEMGRSGQPPQPAGMIGVTGNLTSQASAGINPGATGADNVLAVYTIPANVFDQAGRSLQITAQGDFAANANAKRCKIIVNPSSAVVGSTVGSGGTTIADTGASTGDGVGWFLQASVTKYGAPGSNTQTAQEEGTIVGATHGGCGLPQALTLTESGSVLLAVTGNATTAVTDIALSQFQVQGQN